MTTKSFQSMKKNREAATEKLAKALANTQGGNFQKEDDDRFWKPTIDKTGHASAIIRFLPASEGEEVPFVQLWSHGFKSNKTTKWYIENSLTTIGKEDPVSQINKELWDTGLETNKNIVRARKRKLAYYANILVIKDAGNPENNGKVFLFKYGKKIQEMIEKMQNPVPEFDDEEVTPINPFDFWTGANFRLRVKPVMLNGKQVPNYDESKFDESSALFDGDDAKLEAIWGQQHKLQPLVAEDQFKTYEELYRKLREVLGAEANEYTIFGGSQANKVAGFAGDDAAGESEPAPEDKTAERMSAARRRKAEDTAEAAAPARAAKAKSEDEVPWNDDAPAADQETGQDADQYFKEMFKGD